MQQKQLLITEIIAIEWEMFSNVQNEGGKAGCQSRPDIFTIMRGSQFLAWPELVLVSYLSDLKRARSEQRNLCTEKYGYMMAYTDTIQYEKIKPFLPVIEGEILDKIKTIVAIYMDWEREVEQCYPGIRAKGRPLTSSQDTLYGVSAETYLLCELKTYSEQTIRLLYDYTLSCKAAQTNLAIRILEYTVRAYGYPSLEEAEKRIKQRTKY